MVHRDTGRVHARHALHRLQQRRTTVAIERHRQVITLAQHLVDPLRAAGMRSVLQEEPNAVVVGALDQRREIDRVHGLPEKGIGRRVAGGCVAVVGGMRVEPDAGDGRGGAMVQRPPLLGERPSLGTVDDEVVAEAGGLGDADALGDASARVRIARDHQIAGPADDRQVDPRLVGDERKYLVDGRAHAHGSPADRHPLGHGPGAPQRMQLAAQLP